MRKRVLANLVAAIAAVTMAASHSDTQPASVTLNQAIPADSTEGLPGYSQALEFMRTAQEIYVFPNTNPRYPHRDDQHMRLLDSKARAALMGTFDADKDWWQGLYEMGVPEKPPTDVGFVFKTGKDELVLFFRDSIADGTWNGQSLKGMLSEDSAKRLREWEAKYAKVELAAPAETPPPIDRAPYDLTVIDGVPVGSEDLKQVTASDWRVALAAFEGAGLSHPHTVLAISRDEVRGYLQSDEWMTAERIDCAEAVQGHSCWNISPHQLPQYAEAMRNITEAKYVHIFPMVHPLGHYRDFDHSQMLDDRARRDLVGLLGSADSWSEAKGSSMSPPGQLPADFGFEIGDGEDWVRLFFSSDGKVQGDFDGEYLSGALNKRAAQELQEWKAKYIKSWTAGTDHA